MVKMFITFDPILLFLEMYSKGIIWNSNKDSCTKMYATELFIREALETPQMSNNRGRSEKIVR